MKSKRIVLAVLILSLLFSSVFAVNAEEKVTNNDISAILQNDYEKLVCVSKYGDTVNYPENSAEGVAAAADAGADIILVSVKKTADDVIVLMADNNLSRMCVDSNNETMLKNVSEVGLFELQTCHLRNGTGLLHEKITAYTVPTLRQTIEQLNGRAMLLIDGGWQFRDDIYNLLVEMNVLNSSVIIADGSKKEVSQWLTNKTSMPLVFSKYTGNVVWNSGAYIKKTSQAGTVGVILGDNNAYSTSFSASTVAKLNGKGRAVVDMTSPDLCGGRQDNSIGWDDMTSRGFSVIITNNIVQLKEYSARVDISRKRLSALIERAAGVDMTLCSTNSANNLKTAISSAKSVAAESVSAMQLESSYCILQSALGQLTDRTSDDNAGKTITKGRITAAVCVVAGLIIMEICFEHYRNKRIAVRKQGKKKKVKKDKNDLNF